MVYVFWTLALYLLIYEYWLILDCTSGFIRCLRILNLVPTNRLDTPVPNPLIEKEYPLVTLTTCTVLVTDLESVIEILSPILKALRI